MTIPFRKSLRDFRGFTLVELLVVIAIIGILATLLLLQLGTARGKARDTKRIADVNQLRTAVELYYDDNGGNYPGASPLTYAMIGSYLSVKVLPMDPLDATKNYKYAYYTASGKTLRFQLWSNLEQKNASAFSADADLITTAGGDWPAAGAGNAVNGSLETCTNAGPTYDETNGADCIYDVGQK